MRIILIFVLTIYKFGLGLSVHLFSGAHLGGQTMLLITQRSDKNRETKSLCVGLTFEFNYPLKKIT